MNAKVNRTEAPKTLKQKQINSEDIRAAGEFAQVVKDLMFDMEKAASDDKRAFLDKRPAFNKLLIAEKIYS